MIERESDIVKDHKHKKLLDSWGLNTKYVRVFDGFVDLNCFLFC